MLNWSFILQRIKDEMSLPSVPLELQDEDIIDYLKRNALLKFETFFPDKNRITIDCSDETLFVPGRTSEFYLFDPDDREIKDVIAMYTTGSDDFILGHNIMGAYSFDQLEGMVLSNMKARTVKQFSDFMYITEFMAPNKLRISPKFAGTCVIEYSRSHDPELSTIVPNLHDYFVDLCVGMTMMRIGKIRTKFSTYTTPFGEITVNGQEIYNEGKELTDKVIEKLTMGSLPNIVFDCA